MTRSRKALAESSNAASLCFFLIRNRAIVPSLRQYYDSGGRSEEDEERDQRKERRKKGKNEPEAAVFLFRLSSRLVSSSPSIDNSLSSSDSTLTGAATAFSTLAFLATFLFVDVDDEAGDDLVVGVEWVEGGRSGRREVVATGRVEVEAMADCNEGNSLKSGKPFE